MDFLLKNFIKNGFIFDSKNYMQYNKNDILKKGKATPKVFCKFQKNLHLGFGGTPTSVEWDIPIPCLHLVQIPFCIQFSMISNYFLI